MFRMLLVDSSPRLKTESENFWRDTGYKTDFVQVSTMQAAIEAAHRITFWYIDINADTVDYIPHLAELRQCTNVPIIALSAEIDTYEAVTSYYAGLDVLSTWEAGVYSQTAESVIAYMSRHDKSSPVKEPGIPKVLVYNDIVLSCEFHRCTMGNTEIPMTKTEFEILYCLILNRGHVLSPRQIYFFVWGEDRYDETLPEALRAHVKRLRKKIIALNPSFNNIENVKGIGYRFVN